MVVYFSRIRFWVKRSLNLGIRIREYLLLLFLSFTGILTEIFGIGMFLPIFQFMQEGGSLDVLTQNSKMWKYLESAFIYFDINLSLPSLLLISFFFFSIRQIVTYIRLIYTSLITQKLKKIQRDKLFSDYIKAKTTYHDGMSIGGLVNVITTEVNSAVRGVMSPIDLVVYFIMLLGYLSMLTILSWEITFFAAFAMLVISRIPSTWIKHSAKTGRKIVNVNLSISSFLVERIKSPRLVRLSGTEDIEREEFKKLTQTQKDHEVTNAMLQSKTETVIEPIVIGLSLIFLYLAYSFLNLQVEVIGLYLVVILRLVPTLKGVISQWQSVQVLLGSIEALEDRFKEMQDSYEENTGFIPIEGFNKSIVFSNVSYKYPNSDKKALSNITFDIKKGSMLAIVGPSGSGKSTLIDLIPRLRESTSGVIKVDGKNINNYELGGVRHLISFVSQEPQIFNGSIKDHILYGCKAESDESLWESLRLAGAESFVLKLPNGVDTIIGENCSALSGGQKQRIDLARALLCQKPILILDEPTSSLDIELENEFNESLKNIHENRDTTIIIVTHSLHSVIGADKIIILNNGIIESEGTHAELIEKSDWYASAWRKKH